MVFDQTKINMAVPRYNTDKIIGVFTGSFAVAAPTAIQRTLLTEVSIPHGFGDTCLAQMVYSTDGVTYNDGDMQVPRLTGAFPVLQTLEVAAYTTSTNVVVSSTNWYDSVAGAGFTYTIYYKVFCIAKKTQGTITPIPTGQILKYSSAQNYQKIAIDQVVPLTLALGSTTTQSIAHGLLSVPSTRAYVEYLTAGKLWPVSRNQHVSTGLGAANNPLVTDIKINATTIDYVFNNSGGNVNINFHYRIYLES